VTASLSDFAVRTASAGLLGVVMLAALFFGGLWGIAVLAAVISALALTEFFALSRRGGRRPQELLGLGASVAMPVVAVTAGRDGLTVVAAALVVAALASHVFSRSSRLAETAVTVFGSLYIGFSLAHLVLIRRMDDGTMLLLSMIVGVWVNDIAAYLAGSAFGRRPLAPRISPHKTWEGLAAGTIATVGAWLLLGTYLTELPWPLLVVLGLAASAAAVIGDLTESRFKREADVKDSGRLLPGHGGFLDRFDAFILVTIVTYYVLLIGGVS
jgi:phosphatidate cytidylyltransferase